MRVRTPTSNERMNRFVHAIDAVSVLTAAPFAVILRDPTLLSGIRLTPTCTYCAVGFVVGLLFLIVFHVGRNLGNHISSGEIRSVIVVSLVTAGATSLLLFSIDRLNFIPRSLPLIQALILNSFMLGGRVIAIKQRGFLGLSATNYKLEFEHALIVGANDFTVSYFKMLDAFNVDRTNFVGILDDNSLLYGRSLFGYPVIAPPSALSQIVREYLVHGVKIDHLVISANKPKLGSLQWREVEDNCRNVNIRLEYLSDILGFELNDLEDGELLQEEIATSTGYSIIKRVFDFSVSFAFALTLSPVIAIVVLGILIDLGWPILFWQKRIGHQGPPISHLQVSNPSRAV